MTADRLREAAKVLRERAEAANRVQPITLPRLRDMTEPGHFHHTLLQVEVEYVQTMHPGVGLALADWLDAQGRHVGSYYCETQCEPDGCDETKAAVRLADLILGDRHE